MKLLASVAKASAAYAASSPWYQRSTFEREYQADFEMVTHLVSRLSVFSGELRDLKYLTCEMTFIRNINGRTDSNQWARPFEFASRLYENYSYIFDKRWSQFLSIFSTTCFVPSKSIWNRLRLSSDLFFGLIEIVIFFYFSYPDCVKLCEHQNGWLPEEEFEDLASWVAIKIAEYYQCCFRTLKCADETPLNFERKNSIILSEFQSMVSQISWIWILGYYEKL